MPTTPPSPLNSRHLDPKSLLHTSTWKLNRPFKRSTFTIKLLISIPPTSTSSQSSHQSHFILPVAQAKMLGRRISVFIVSLSHLIWFLRHSCSLASSKYFYIVTFSHHLLFYYPGQNHYHLCLDYCSDILNISPGIITVPPQSIQPEYFFIDSSIKSFLCWEPVNSFLPYSEEKTIFKTAWNALQDLSSRYLSDLMSYFASSSSLHCLHLPFLLLLESSAHLPHLRSFFLLCFLQTLISLLKCLFIQRTSLWVCYIKSQTPPSHVPTSQSCFTFLDFTCLPWKTPPL